MPHIDALKKLVWIEHPSWIVRDTDKAIGLHENRFVKRDKPLWIPKSLLGRVRYADGRETSDVKYDHEITAFEAPLWWAKQQRLI